MKLLFLSSRWRVCFRGVGARVEEAEEGVGGAAGMKREGIVATEEIRAM